VIRGPRDVIVPHEVVDAHAEAERVVEEARAEATRIVAEADAAAEATRAEARAAGSEEARAEAAALLAEAASRRDSALADAEREVARLAVAVAERLLCGELEARPEAVLAIVREVLERARRAQSLVLRAHPDDAAVLRRHAEALPSAIVVEDDPSVRRGGCVVKTELGALDGRLEVRLEALARALGLDASA
jgi:type III secretion system HrpE/YscL family protein